MPVQEEGRRQGPRGGAQRGTEELLKLKFLPVHLVGPPVNVGPATALRKEPILQDRPGQEPHFKPKKQ